MRYVLAVVMAMVAACSSGGGDDGDDQNPGAVSVSVSGRMSSDAALRVMAAEVPAPSAEAVDSPYSTLDGVVVEGRFSDIIQGEFVTVETSITNNSAVAIDAIVEIYAEDASFATPEMWTCMKCYPKPDGESCNGLWDTEGGTILAPVPAPDLEVCDASVPETSGYCVDIFPDGVDCASPTWRIDYLPPGDGLWKAETEALIGPGETWTDATGYSNNSMDIRPDHYSRWVVKDRVTGDILVGGQKDYAFDVVAP